MAGVNRALADTYLRGLYEKEIEDGNIRKKCVYLSFRAEDLAAADAVAQYLMGNNIDVFLTKDLPEDRDVEQKVRRMEDGMNTSTHLLILLPKRSELSWLVPYEIGYAKRSGKGIAAVLLKSGEDTFPEYLKKERTIWDLADFRKYTEEVRKCVGIYKLFEKPITEPLGLYPYVKNFGEMK